MTEVDELEARLRALEIMVQFLMEARASEHPAFLGALKEALKRVGILSQVANDQTGDQAFAASVRSWMQTFIDDTIDHLSENRDLSKLEGRLE